MKRFCYIKLDNNINILLIMKNGLLSELKFLKDKEELTTVLQDNDTVEDCGLFSEITRQIVEYFTGKRRSFNIKYDLEMAGYSLTVLKNTKNIPFGRVVTYRDLSRICKSPKAWRATGNALSANPLPIIIPCHRVVRSDRRPGNFGRFPEIKRYLLELEGVNFTNGRIDKIYFISPDQYLFMETERISLIRLA